MRLAEIMSTPVYTIERNLDLESARELMRVHRVRHLVVVEAQTPVGILSDHEMGGALDRFEPAVGTAADRMIRRPVTATPQTTVREAANMLRGHRIGALPIVENGKLCGIVTVTDLLDLLGRGAVAPSPGKRRVTLSKRRPALGARLRAGEV